MRVRRTALGVCCAAHRSLVPRQRLQGSGVRGQGSGFRVRDSYLGDLMFHALMRTLIDGATPLLTESDPHLEWSGRLTVMLIRYGVATVSKAEASAQPQSPEVL